MFSDIGRFMKTICYSYMFCHDLVKIAIPREAVEFAHDALSATSITAAETRIRLLVVLWILLGTTLCSFIAETIAEIEA